MKAHYFFALCAVVSAIAWGSAVANDHPLTATVCALGCLGYIYAADSTRSLSTETDR